MTSVTKVTSAFLAKMLDDDWGPSWTKEEIEADLRQLLDAALPHFKFPRVSLDIYEYAADEDGKLLTDENGEYYTDPNAEYTVSYFEDNLSNEEIQIVSTYMKCEWLNRSILTWERIKPLYEERDFSEANMLDKLYDALEAERNRALKLEAIYYRSIKRSPWDYTRLAGDVSDK